LIRRQRQFQPRKSDRVNHDLPTPPATIPSGPAEPAAKPGTYSVGTLTYTKAGLFMVFGWLLWGDFCFTLFESIGGPDILTLYLQDNFKVSNVQTNVIFNIIPMTIGIIVGPMIAFKSDRHRGRKGRRIPFIIWTTPFLCLFAAAIGFADEIITFTKATFPVDGMVAPFTIAMLLISILVIGFSFFNEFVNTVYWFLFADVVPKQFLGRFLGLFRLVGAGAGFLINYTIAEHQLTHMRAIHVGVAILYFVGFSMMCWRVKEGQYPPVTDVTAKTTFMQQVRLYFRECFTHPIFILVYATTFAAMFARAANISGIWGLHLGQHVASVEAHQGATGALAMTADGKRLLSVGADGAARLWEAQAQSVPTPWYDAVHRGTLPAGSILAAQGSALKAAVLAPDGRWAAAAGDDGVIRVWQLTATGTATKTDISPDIGSVRALAVSPDGTRLASAGDGTTVQIWDMPAGTLALTLDSYASTVRALAFSQDGSRIAAGLGDGTVCVDDTSIGTSRKTLIFTTPGPVNAVLFMPELSAAPATAPASITGFEPLDGPIRYFIDVFTNESLYDHPASARSTVGRTDAWIVTGGQEDGDDSRSASLRIWNASDGTAVATMKGHKQAITSIAYKSDLHLIASGSLDTSLRLWNPARIDALANDHSLRSISGYTLGVTAIAAQTNGNGIITASTTGGLNLWNIDAGIGLRKVGIRASFFSIIALLLAYPLGYMVDRFHALRISLYAAIALVPVPFFTYFCMYDYATSAYLEAYKVMIFDIIGAATIPLLISIFPDEKFGQMCSANGMVNQASRLACGFFGALLMDWLTRSTLLTENYRYGNLWAGFGFLLQAVLFYILYRKWKSMGGDKGYVAPEHEAAPAPQ